jgi:phospholipid transport system substrate-binding protein
MGLLPRRVTVAVFLAVFLAVAPASAGDATRAMDGTVHRILSLLTDKTLAAPEKRTERRRLIMAEVDRRFDFVEISMRALGRPWRDLDRDQRIEFVRLFSELLKKTYIRRIEAYSNEKVEFRKERRSGKRAMVYSVVVKGGQEIPINYAMKLKKGRWRVYDVVIEGVSLVRNYRTEFSRVMRKEKYAGLVDRLRRKIDELAAGEGKTDG